MSEALGKSVGTKEAAALATPLLKGEAVLPLVTPVTIVSDTLLLPPPTPVHLNLERHQGHVDNEDDALLSGMSVETHWQQRQKC
jgi:hypothetical protein